MPFAGLDLLKQVIEAAILDEEGKLVHKSRFPATREALLGFAKRWLNRDCSVAVEATTNIWPVVDLLEPLVAEVVVSNPMRTRAIASAKVKTDSIDARTLAELLHMGYLPRVWQPDETTRHQRELVTERTTLTADRTRIKNRIHSVLHQRMIPAPDLGGSRWLAGDGRLVSDGQCGQGRHRLPRGQKIRSPRGQGEQVLWERCSPKPSSIRAPARPSRPSPAGELRLQACPTLPGPPPRAPPKPGMQKAMLAARAPGLDALLTNSLVPVEKQLTRS